MKKKSTINNAVDSIIVRGAREHNLKDVSVTIPKYSLTVITGPSGSGKSSLAFDVLYEEGRRRYVESLSSYARQFLGASSKPNVESIEGLCPAIAIEQKTIGSNPRSTVGTVTEIYDYLRILYARIGKAYCPRCSVAVHAESPESIALMVANRFSESMISLCAPIAIKKKGEFGTILHKLFNSGYYRVRIDGEWHKFTSPHLIDELNLKKTHHHTIDILIDVIEEPLHEQSRIQSAVEAAFEIASGICRVIMGSEEFLYSRDRICLECNESIPELEPRSFSFNSFLGACNACQGLGVVRSWQSYDASSSEGFDFSALHVCKECNGKRLNKQALSVLVGQQSIADLSNQNIIQLKEFFNSLKLDETEAIIARGLLKEITARLGFLESVGLGYLTLDRGSSTLSGGESQRIRLATQIGSMLSGVLYVLDEPSIGLHQKDNDRLIDMLEHLRDIGNTVVVVEHDLDTVERADFVIDMGPAAGVHGGQVVAVGSPQELKKNKHSLTGAFLSGKRTIPIPLKTRPLKNFLTLSHASSHNLKDITVKVPLHVLCGVSGVSGSGKSTLIMQELVSILKKKLEKLPEGMLQKTEISGWENIESLVVIDQAPIGRTPRSNFATYLGIFDDIRKLYASLPESNARGYSVGRFSFNTAEGRCVECHGDGTVTFEMHFLPAVTVVCKACKGKRYNKATLEILYKGKSISDVLQMTAQEALEFFAHHRSIARRLQLLTDVGLEYLQLGQPSTTLSGGEAQRIKLVDELAKRGHNTLYILDEPTTGLHNSDIERLLIVLNTLVDKGNSMIVIEHNLDVLKTVDYLIDLGPEGGNAGGIVVATGTPKQVSKVKESFTGHYLKRYFE
jgi:excinuclease ABC subunit A